MAPDDEIKRVLLGMTTATLTTHRIELLAATQAYELQTVKARRALATEAVYQAVRVTVAPYADDRPLAGDMALARDLIRQTAP
jgi:histidine ammonia-lyase